jgi:molybdopterin-binding protein
MIEVHDLHKKLGDFAVRGITLAIEEREYFVLLGPTGAGKTVLLECIAGLHPVDGGQVLINGRDVTHLVPEHRHLSYVPQDYVLFPHLSVFDNIAFSLRLQGWGTDRIAERVRELSDMLGITPLLGRSPRTLSGGEQQRTAIARALAPGPTALLLDEPLSALDENTRIQIAAELQSLPARFGTTVIHVCHNFEEALRLATRLAVLYRGRLVQVGSPDEVFTRPNCRFVAEFMRVRNILPVAGVEVADGRLRCAVAGGPVLEAAASGSGLPAETPAMLALRPESINVAARSLEGENAFEAKVLGVYPLGSSVEIALSIEGIKLYALLTRQMSRRLDLAPGSGAWLQIPADAVHLLPDTFLPPDSES